MAILEADRDLMDNLVEQLLDELAGLDALAFYRAGLIGSSWSTSSRESIPSEPMEFYSEPTFNKASFTCPHCGARTAMRWQRTGHPITDPPDGRRIHYALCQSSDCERMSVWVAIESPRIDGQGNTILDYSEPELVWPPVRRGPHPNPDLPDDVRKDYEEARAILEHSPRAAAALLRLALQRLMKELGLPGEDLNSDIAALVADGLRADVQKAADALRVIGNEAVHPGEIDTDEMATVLGLFELLNIIADDRISQPKRIETMFATLPESKRKAIEERDAQP